jgi:hypothetical protein
MHGAGRVGLANTARNERLDIATLDLDVHSGPAANCVEGFTKRRNPASVGERKVLELGSRKLGDGAMRRSLRMPGVDHRIMVNHDHTVARCVNIELDPVGP